MNITLVMCSLDHKYHHGDKLKNGYGDKLLQHNEVLGACFKFVRETKLQIINAKSIIENFSKPKTESRKPAQQKKPGKKITPDVWPLSTIYVIYSMQYASFLLFFLLYLSIDSSFRRWPSVTFASFLFIAHSPFFILK